MTVDLYIPGSLSLKDKRAVLRRVKDRIGKNFNVSIAEVDFHDKWQRARIGIAQVGKDYDHVEKCMTTIFNILDDLHDAEIVEHSMEYL